MRGESFAVQPTCQCRVLRHSLPSQTPLTAGPRPVAHLQVEPLGPVRPVHADRARAAETAPQLPRLGVGAQQGHPGRTGLAV